MVEDGILSVIKAAFEWAILPLVGAVAYFFRKYITRVEKVESRIHNIEVRMAVFEANIVHIRKDIEDIKKGVEKILDKL